MQTPLSSLAVAGAVALSLALCETRAHAFGGSGGTVCPQPGGPDLIIGNLLTPANYSAEEIELETFDAFAFGRDICNIGDQNLAVIWYPSTNHPAFAHNLYKLKDGRIEQVGMSWVCHQMTVLTANLCGCGCNGMGGSLLGAGCSDPKTGSQVGSQPLLSPRWQINAYSGEFPSDPANPPFDGSSTARRLRVKAADLEPSSPTVQYV